MSEPAYAACRFCGSSLHRTVVDLGMSPLCESYLTAPQLDRMEPFYPLHVRVCNDCFLVQLEQFVAPEDIFTEYAYFSSYSDSWVEHAWTFTEMIIRRLGLSDESFVVEVASNDGYLLQHFVERGIPVLGIEPARNVARTAIDRGVPTDTSFFGVERAQALVRDRRGADLLIANNVLAHVPDLNDFVRGLALALAPAGVLTIEFPHLMRLVEENQFDTIYHEHFSYFSFVAARRILEAHGLEVFDVEELPTHGGSLRIYARRAGSDAWTVELRVVELAARETAAGYLTTDPYAAFGERVAQTKRELLKCLISAKEAGETLVGYGAPGKGNTLLNYCGIGTDFLEYTVDRNPYKQGLFLPGTHVPIFAPDRIAETRPDVVLILPWNLKHEIAEQLAYTRVWGARCVVPIPHVEVLA